MGGLFGGKQKIPDPKPVRMPTETDPEIEAAVKRNREATRLRRGRQSTILTDSTNETTGSPADRKLGG